MGNLCKEIVRTFERVHSDATPAHIFAQHAAQPASKQTSTRVVQNKVVSQVYQNQAQNKLSKTTSKSFHQPCHGKNNWHLLPVRNRQDLGDFFIKSTAFFNVSTNKQQLDLVSQQASLHLMQTEHKASRPLVLQRILLVGAFLQAAANIRIHNSDHMLKQ